MSDQEKEVLGTPFREFTDPKHQLVNSENRNAYDIYCGGCAKLILRANLGTWVERSEEKKYLEKNTSNEILVNRPPVVDVMGHVEHGKITMLDIINQTGQQKKKAGGITQKATISQEKLLFGYIDSDNSSNQGFWVSNDITVFENVGVTDAVDTGVKYICCLSCCVGRGPLGYNDTTAAVNEYLIAADQFSYLRK
ncbi:hypothetical protein C1646_663999 [Rhizophagus diaphanus]|nr:hypothetical protein C1646_663999 [Rhizophagus diaphanus] [Rhizophagus sp. MUCL 43196]